MPFPPSSSAFHFCNPQSHFCNSQTVPILCTSCANSACRPFFPDWHPALPHSGNVHRQHLLRHAFNRSLIRGRPRKSAEKNFPLAQLLRIDPLPPCAYSHFHFAPQKPAPRGRDRPHNVFARRFGTPLQQPRNQKRIAPLPREGIAMNERPWTAYRTRFLVHARKLTAPLIFTDALGREHSGQPGDYLVESSDGLRRITPCHLFEDIYVPLHASANTTPPQVQAPGQVRVNRSHRTPAKPVSTSAWAPAGSTSAKGGLARSS